MKNSLIIGFGKRVKTTVFPALKIINDGVLYIYTRNFEKINLINNEYDFVPVKKIDDDLLLKISRIFVCTPNIFFDDILKNISKLNTKNIDLYIDTPILPKISNLNLIKYRFKFKNIFVSEDYYFNPINRIVKDIISEYKLGPIKSIEYINDGYGYHSLAQSRYLLGELNIIFGFKNKHFYKFNFIKNKIKISGNKIDEGYTVIETKENKIYINHRNKILDMKLNYIYKEGVIYGYTLNDKKIHISKEIKNDFKNLISICKKYKIYKRIFQEQIISFVNLIKQSEKLNGDKYYLDDGIKDSFIIAITNKIKIYLDLSHKNNLVLLTIFKNLYLTLFKKK